MKQLTTPLIILLLLGASLSGCFGKEEVLIQEEETTYPSIWDRHLLEWNTTHTHSFVLEPGPHYSLDVQEATIEVDTTGVWDGGRILLKYTCLIGYHLIPKKVKKYQSLR